MERIRIATRGSLLAQWQAEHVAPKLAVLNSSQGCLSETGSTRTPRYRLTAGQRGALRRFIDSYRRAPDGVSAPTFDLQRRMAQLRCHGCHEIDGRAPTGVIAEDAPPDPYRRAASQLDGAASVLVGIAANMAIESGAMIEIGDLFDLPPSPVSD